MRRRRRGQAHLCGLYADVGARGEIAGPSATDPKILPGLWVYATRGRRLGSRDRALIQLHAYRWLCGGVAVAYHRLDDFRSDHGDVFSELVTQLLARPMKHDLLDLRRVPRTAPGSAPPPAPRRFDAVRPSSG